MNFRFTTGAFGMSFHDTRKAEEKFRRASHQPSCRSACSCSQISPYERPSYNAPDVTFIVEGREIQFWKSFLAASSPVFERLFSDLKEENITIQLPGKTYEEMNTFFEQFHPACSWKPINDNILEAMLRLANEYQADAVRQKCQLYITTEIEKNATSEGVQANRGALDIYNRGYSSLLGSRSPSEVPHAKLAIERVLFYLLMCEKYNLPHPRRELIRIASSSSVKAMEQCRACGSLCDSTKIELLKERCLWLERRYHVD